MRLEPFRYDGVAGGGELPEGGAVHTRGAVRFSESSGGCSQPGCQCSDGYWVCITLPERGGSVEGVTIHCDSRAQAMAMAEWMHSAAAEFAGLGRKELGND